MKLFRPISVPVVLLAFIGLSWLPLLKTDTTFSSPIAHTFSDSASHVAANAEITSGSLYASLDLGAKGLSKEAFLYAYRGYLKLQQQKKIHEGAFLTICDFSQSANRKRLYLIDMTNQTLVLSTYVAHGRNSGAEYATSFSNRPESLQSSLGFYVTRQTYYGGHGLSLRVEGVEKGYNDNALQRSIVVHGADYIGDSRLRNSPYMGRSFGCPAVPAKESANIINTIKDGSCLFIYHPSQAYLKGSKLLNA